MDPDVIASDGAARAGRRDARLAARAARRASLEEGQERGEFTPALDPEDIAATVVATVQGGYVLARAAARPRAFDSGVAGLLSLLASHPRAWSRRRSPAQAPGSHAMHAMQYEITLPADYDMGIIRHRVAPEAPPGRLPGPGLQGVRRPRARRRRLPGEPVRAVLPLASRPPAGMTGSSAAQGSAV